MKPRHLLVFSSLLAAFLLLSTRNVSSEPYVYDEADYMYAASLGFAANWSDTPSIPIADFIRAGVGHKGRKVLSEQIRNGNDVLFYRHFHGPLFHYLLIAVSRLGLSEHAVRGAMMAIPCFGLAVVYFGCLWLGTPHSAVAALLAGILYLSSYAVIGSTELAPHQLFTLCSLGTLIFLLKARATGGPGYWYAAVVTSALAFCTLEVGLVLGAVVAVCGWIDNRKQLLKSAVLFLVIVSVTWPAAIFRASFLKSCAVMAYLSLARSAAWGNAGFVDAWRARIFASPLEWAIVFVALALGFRSARQHYPVALLAGLMIAATLRVVTDTPRYSLVFMPALELFAGLTLAPLLGTLRRPASFAVVALAVGALYGSAFYRAAHRPHNPNPRSAAVLTFIHQNGLENKAVLAPQADIPTLHYYFRGMRLRAYLGDAPALAERAGFAGNAIIPAPAVP